MIAFNVTNMTFIHLSYNLNMCDAFQNIVLTKDK